MDPSIFDFIEKVVYINLAKRTDRREHMESFIKTFSDKVIRFEAIEYNPGIIGCAKSHIGVLEMAIENNWKNVLILEDDIEWNNKEESVECFKNLSKQDFDVLLLGGTGSKFCKNTCKLTRSCCTHAYIVNNHYFPTLLENFKESIALYEETKLKKYYLDEHWKILMPKDKWYIIIPNLIYQLDGYSDTIKNIRTNFSLKFML